MKKRSYEFHKIDVLSDPMAYDHMRRISKQSLTHFDMGNIAGQILADFDVAQLENFVLENSLLP